MTDQGNKDPQRELQDIMGEHSHVEDHVKRMYKETGEFPLFVDEITGDHEVDKPNILYPATDEVYIHIYGDIGKDTTYYAIEPTLSEDEQEIYKKIQNQILRQSGGIDSPRNKDEYSEKIETLLDEVTIMDNGSSNENTVDNLRKQLGIGFGKEVITEKTYKRVKYNLERDIVGLGPLEAVMRDTNNEDIHVIGYDQCYVDHGVFSLINTNIGWESKDTFNRWLKNIGERIGSPLTDSDPIVDATLPDGSRLNVVYSEDISVQGPSLTIRQNNEDPLSIVQITKWGTLSPELAAYLWLALENEQTIFVVGETASGKTTTLNSALSFIPRDSKIYTAEDTAEVVPPHNTWQQLLTRESGNEGDVSMFNLVETALRSRPDYIIVGEVRGEEGRMAFQAAQTGHPVMLTFHASDIVSMIQRFTGEPINVPETFMDVADIALFQNRVKQGDKVLRRVTSVQEIEGYSDDMGGVVTRQAFRWNPVDDNIIFQGQDNSYVLEDQIATLLGYADTRDIYDDLKFRARIIERMIEHDILGYEEVNKTIKKFQRDGVEGLPFGINRNE